ncbi:MAG: hypothetical protein ACE5FM_05530 [Methyloligellaceae bacterium]
MKREKSRPEMGGFFFGYKLLAAIKPLTGNRPRLLEAVAPLKKEVQETICFWNTSLRTWVAAGFFRFFSADRPLPAIGGAMRLRARRGMPRPRMTCKVRKRAYG